MNQSDDPFPAPVSTEDLLKQRGAKYGSFDTHALITQALKDCIYSAPGVEKNKLNHYHKEALDMICHKIGRIVNGDPDHIDSWDDIAGYATLVSKILRGEPL